MSEHLKTDLSPPPPLLSAFENGISPRKCFILSAMVGLLWLGLGAGDWYMRFHWFGWHRNFIVRASETPAAGSECVVTNAPVRGGDLSRLVGISGAASRFEQEHPGATNFYDASGFRNAPPFPDRYPVAVVGDSYAAAGPGNADTLSAQLAEILGVPVCNHAAEGRGTFWAAVRFFASEHFRGKEPRVLVWPVIEREMAGGYFDGGLYQISKAQSTNAAEKQQAARIDWQQLHPKSLRSSLPNTSAYSLVAGKVWNRVRYEVFGQLNPAVVASASDVAGGPMLFYAEAVATERWPDETRDVERLVRVTAVMSEQAKSRGMALLFVLVPDKERIYANALPERIRRSVRPSVFPEVERRMREAGVSVVNLLPVFEQAAARGELLFWRDDTHWNPAGIRLAAEVSASEVKRLLTERR